MSDICKTLVEISEVMSDAYYFVSMRDLVEQWAELATNGSKPAQDMLSVINTFHRLCVAVKKQ